MAPTPFRPSGGDTRLKSSLDGCSNIQMGYGTIIVGANVDTIALR